ncbi:MAG: hypothetical protein WC511_02030 [Candidatus Pacearchaeota archaeon]
MSRSNNLHLIAILDGISVWEDLEKLEKDFPVEDCPGMFGINGKEFQIFKPPLDPYSTCGDLCLKDNEIAVELYLGSTSFSFDDLLNWKSSFERILLKYVRYNDLSFRILATYS